jgi:elongator complex protein 3
MPGLLGSNSKKDFLMFQKLFSDSNFQPDMLKIYPTVVTKNSALYKLWKAKKYRPLTDNQFKKLILKIKKDAIPPYVRIARLVRDVPATSIVAGPKISNLRQLIAPQSQCLCIRCREVRADYKINERVLLDRIDYDASAGLEIFLQFVSPDKKKLFALLRLRIPNFVCHPERSEGSQDNIVSCNSTGFFAKTQNDKLYNLIPALRNSALIREVHTYGQLTQIDKYNKKSPQHFGLGKKLMAEAEKIVKEEFKLNKIAVISGIGARNYYRKLGYTLKDTYMIKYI